MNIEEFRDYCLSMKGVTEHFPFDNRILVFKVMDKIFALADVEEFDSINLKCDPELALELREQYQAVTGGYHMNKKYWNTVRLNADVSDVRLCEMIQHSYHEVIRKLPKKLQLEWQNLPD